MSRCPKTQSLAAEHKNTKLGAGAHRTSAIYVIIYSIEMASVEGLVIPVMMVMMMIMMILLCHYQCYLNDVNDNHQHVV